MKKLTIKEFNSLPNREKKILVAKDVLAQLKIGKYIAEIGKYIAETGNYCVLDIDLKNREDLDVKSNFSKINNCTVCALGSAIISITKFANKLTFRDIEEDIQKKNVQNILFSVFSKSEVRDIENAFEQGFSPYAQFMGMEVTNDTNEKGEDFMDYHSTAKARLTAIMKQIVDTGTFKL